MKVHCLGSRFHASQVQRIEDGFRALGHEVTEHSHLADLVFVNNPWFDQPLKDRAAGNLPGKLILGVQDVPHHTADYDLPRLRAQLAQADAVTAISETTARDVLAATGIRAHVIYQPVMDVRRDPAVRRQPFYRFASVGRRSDPNKFAPLWVAALQILGYTEQDVCLVGNEGGWGDYQGVLAEANLNVVYNSVDFVLCPSKNEGLLLPCIEAMACGAVPLVATHLTTLDELLPADLFPEFRYCLPHPASIARFIAHYVNDDSGTRLANLRQRLHDHYRTTWAERTSPTGVASRILAAYQSTLT